MVWRQEMEGVEGEKEWAHEGGGVTAEVGVGAGDEEWCLRF